MALYAYAVVDSGIELPAGLEAVDVGRLRAVVREVDVAEYEGDRLQQNLEDPTWLEAAVRRHQGTIEGLLGVTDGVVPMQFGSIFSEPGGLQAMLETNADDLVAVLERIRGRHEWGIKVRVDVAAVARDLVPASTGGGGRAYLQRRKDEQDAASRVAEQATAAADDVHRALGEVADAAALLAIRPVSGGGQVVLNGAYLVATGSVDAFHARLDDLRRSLGDAYRFDVSGPWPPYSFTTVDVSGAH